ncbi:MAG: hypothetical protein EBZ48_10955, partial [Proteobacteria bacterium]|nr:hypothetical protein [Pseudomonadota bacterium]
ALQRCQAVLLVVDEDRASIKRSIDTLRRMKKESDDPEEFDLSRWTVVVNGYTGDRVPIKEIAALFEAGEILGASLKLVAIPYSQSGCCWAETDLSLYDLAEPPSQAAVERLSHGLLSFRSAPPEPTPEGLWHRILTRVRLR